MRKFLYMFISFTWGIIMSFVGAVTSLILLALGYKPIKYRSAWYFICGRNFNGLSLGPCFIIGRHNFEFIPHQYGHCIQNCIFGAFYPFIIALPSLIRAWYRTTYFYRKSDIFEAVAMFIIVYALFTIVASLFHNEFLWLWIILAIGVYAASLTIWIVYIEGVKYKKDHYPLYDDIWFEWQATKIGDHFNK